jgi:hypothetical protein
LTAISNAWTSTWATKYARLAAVAGDVEHEINRPQRRGESVTDAMLAPAGRGIALADAIRHAGGFGVIQFDKPVIGIFLAQDFFDRSEALSLGVGLLGGKRVDVRSGKRDAILEVSHEEWHPFRALGDGGAGDGCLWVFGDDGVG